MRLRHVLAFAFLAVAGGALGREELNLISAVDVKGEGAFVILTVTGSKPPNFTTFSMADPPRFVIDLSEAKFQGVPEDVPAGDGLIRAVKSLSYGSDATSIARILVAFTADVDPPEVLSQGTSLVVRIERPAGAAGMMVAQADAGAQRAREEAEANARAEAEQRAREEAEATARAQTQQADDAAAAAALAEAQRRADEAAAAAALANAAVDAELRAREDRKPVQEAPDAQAQAGIDAELKAGDEAREAAARRAQVESERLEALAAAKAEEVRSKREEAAEAKRLREEAIAAARTEAERKKLEEAERRAEAKRQREEAIAAAKAEAEQRRLEEAERRAEARRQRDEERLAQAGARDDALAAGAPSAQLREIGFRQMPGVSRVFVRTSVPARFNIQDVGENMIRVELENTRITRRNDARFLDTSFFPSAVALITPSRRGSSYVVDIKLKQRVPYQQRIEGDMLAIDFERPAGGAGGAEPTFGAAGHVVR